MFDKREDCPACGHLTFSNFLICTDHSVSGESFALVQCKHCSHVFTNPKPEQAKLQQYYKSENYISHTNKALNPVQWIYKLIRYKTVRNKENLIHDIIGHQGSLLDFGCGTGHFLKHCNNSGWSSTGIEPDESARLIAEHSGLTVLSSLNEVQNTFDVITAWHVLEHVPEPLETMNAFVRMLKPGGKIVLGLPNHKSFDARNYGSYWAGFDVPRHLSHFNQSSLAALAQRSKLKIEKILPMKYDAYYVSMLSEKYSGSKLSFIKGFITGRNSNINAISSGEYSSLIYILSK